MTEQSKTNRPANLGAMLNQASQQQPNRTAAISELIDRFFDIPSSTIQHTTKLFNDAKAASASIELSQLATASSIDIRKIYCSITGQPLGSLDDRCLQILLQLHGVERAEELLAYGAQTSIARHWVDKSPASLAKLCTIDPYGYFVFAASCAVARHEPINPADRKSADEAAYQIKFLHEKIALWQAIQSVPVEMIIKANEAWRDFLSLINPRRLSSMKIFPYSSLLDFSSLETIAAIASKLKNVMMAVLHKDEQFKNKVRITYSDAISLRQKYQGLSNFRMQGGLKGESEDERIQNILENMQLSVGIWEDTPSRGIRKIAFDKAMKPASSMSTTLIKSTKPSSVAGSGASPVAASSQNASQEQPRKLSLLEMIKATRAKKGA